ncbi:transcriptional regulator [Pedobacter sp. Leaf216]|uniref:helix-turn-helix domain-containing protein n=1 Tax=Pedobacter sp. Leaf216 TaxID=1735684 RepID=UPI00070086EA|nr:helix-turn-helix domain-containing protein [Pedobacter sp. Leaf216]KQM77908.1 transcriptional regulator [Pedobacter sp. Leaf216]
MNIDLITKEDLKEFKTSLIAELKEILKPELKEHKKWLRSAEVREILHISPGTLQNLRINGTLAFTKVGSIFYYALSDIQSLLHKGGKGGR